MSDRLLLSEARLSIQLVQGEGVTKSTGAQNLNVGSKTSNNQFKVFNSVAQTATLAPSELESLNYFSSVLFSLPHEWNRTRLPGLESTQQQPSQI